MRLRKKILPLISIMAIMTSCSQDEELNKSNGTAERATNYLSVNIKNAAGTRALTFEDGTDAESKISRVHFYFFDADGNTAPVISTGKDANSQTSAGRSGVLVWTPEDGKFDHEGTTTDNVTITSAAHLVIQTEKGDAIPTTMVAIINPGTDPIPSASIDALKAATATTAGNTEGNFRMINSSYASNGEWQFAVNVDPYLKRTSAEALENPVSIYVEREQAKVRVDNKITTAKGTTNLFDTQETIDKSLNGEKIYVRFDHWDLTCTANRYYVAKHIKPDWSSNMFGEGEPWNAPDYFRSYWAYNPEEIDFDYKSYSDHMLTTFKFDGKDCVYCIENASPQADAYKTTDPLNTTNRTKVLVAATLYDEGGNKLSLAEVRGYRFISKKDGDDTKALREYLASTSIMKKIKIGESPVRDSDIALKTKVDLDPTKAEEPGIRYVVYAQLKDDYNNRTDITLDGTAKTFAEVNTALKEEFGGIKYWNEGRTYYYADITHLGGYNGVVRNHVYDIELKSLKGTGTPVPDPDEKVYPEKPEKEDTYLAAKINVLAWRVIECPVEFEW